MTLPTYIVDYFDFFYKFIIHYIKLISFHCISGCRVLKYKEEI